jgi:hypothetical protein
MSSRRGYSLALLLFVATIAAGACTSTRPGSDDRQPSAGGGSGQAGSDGLGTLGLQLTLPASHHFSVLSYTLSNGVVNITGSSNISASATLNVLIGSVPSGTYSLSLATTSDDGIVTCSFPAPGDPPVGNIAIMGQTTTIATLNVQCLVVSGFDSGSLLVAASTSYCATWTSIVATPAAGGGSTIVYPSTDAATAIIGVGQSLTLSASATAPDLSQLTFNWSAASGSFSSTTGTVDAGTTDAGLSDQTTFTCPATPGTVVVTLNVSDGPLPDGGSCDARFIQGSLTVNCQPVADSGASDAAGQ